MGAGEAPSAPQALTEEQLTAETQGERAEALTLDDTKEPAIANADHLKVVEYLDCVDSKLDDIRRQHNIGEITVLQSRLESQKSANNTLTSVFAGHFKSLNDGALVQNKDDLLALVQDYPSVRTVLEGPEPTMQAINDAFRSEEARITAEIDQTEAELTAATETENASNNVLNALSVLAVDTIKEKQEDRFDEAKDKYIGKKIEELFPPSDEAEDSLRMYYADNFLSGLLSNAEFTHDPDEYGTAFDACLAKTNDEAIKQYVDNLVSGKEGNDSVNNEEKAIFGEEATQIPPEVRAYVHGLIASNRKVKNGNVTKGEGYEKWIKQRLDGLEPMNVENVERALAGYHVKGLQNFEKGVGEDGESTLDEAPKAVLDVINRNHEVQRIYQQRMAEAMREISDDNKRAEYRTYFLAQVNRLGVENVNDIRSIASPDLWNYGADTLGVLPEGAQPMTGRVPSATTEVAKRLAARCQTSGAETGQVFAFTQDGQIYYAKYNGDGNVGIFTVPGGADLSSDMPERPASVASAAVDTEPVSGSTSGGKEKSGKKVETGDQKQETLEARRDALTAMQGAVNSLTDATAEQVKNALNGLRLTDDQKKSISGETLFVYTPKSGNNKNDGFAVTFDGENFNASKQAEKQAPKAKDASEKVAEAGEKGPELTAKQRAKGKVRAALNRIVSGSNPNLVQAEAMIDNTLSTDERMALVPFPYRMARIFNGGRSVLEVSVGAARGSTNVTRRLPTDNEREVWADRQKKNKPAETERNKTPETSTAKADESKENKEKKGENVAAVVPAGDEEAKIAEAAEPKETVEGGSEKKTRPSGPPASLIAGIEDSIREGEKKDKKA